MTVLPGDQNGLRIDAGANEIVRRLLRRRKVPVGDVADNRAVDFLRKRRRAIVGAQTGFDMRHADAPVKGDHGGSHGARGVALDDQPIEGGAVEERVDLIEQPRRQAAEALAGGHRIEIEIGFDAERVERLHAHLAVLPGVDDSGGDARRGAEMQDHRRQLDRLGARADDDASAHARAAARSAHVS